MDASRACCAREADAAALSFFREEEPPRRELRMWGMVRRRRVWRGDGLSMREREWEGWWGVGRGGVVEAGAGEGGDEDARGGKGVEMERSYGGEDMVAGGL